MLAITIWAHSINLSALLLGGTCITVLLLKLRRLKRSIRRSITLLKTDQNSPIDIYDLPNIAEGINSKFITVADQIQQLTSTKTRDGIPAELENEDVGKALLSVRKQMQVLKQEEAQQQWITNGLAHFVEVLRNKGSAAEYGNLIISSLVKYVGANQGGLFIEYESKEDGRYLELTGMYAYERKRYLTKRVIPGEGLLGQCMFEKDITFITDVPNNYVNITSGLGLATPRNLIVVPLMMNDIFYGAFELASFSILKPHEVEFLKKIGVMIAAEVSAIKTLEHTKVLLSESDKLSNKLQAHEEELRVHVEQLTTAQVEMRKHQGELERKQAELKSYLSAIDNTIASAEFDLSGRISNANTLFLTLTGYSATEIKGRHYTELFLNGDNLLMMWENLMLGKFFSGEFRMRDSRNQEQWLNGTLNPIVDSKGKLEKIMLFAQFTTQEKEKLNELSGVVQALKQGVPVVEFSPDFQCKNANEKFMKLFGVSRIQLKNKKLSDFITTKWYNSYFLKSIEELEGKDQVTMTVEFQEEGRITTWEVSVSRLRNLSGETNRIVMMLINQSESNLVRLAI